MVPEQSSRSAVIKHHLNRVKTHWSDMLLEHPGYDGAGGGGEGGGSVG